MSEENYDVAGNALIRPSDVQLSSYQVDIYVDPHDPTRVVTEQAEPESPAPEPVSAAPPHSRSLLPVIGLAVFLLAVGSCTGLLVTSACVWVVHSLADSENRSSFVEVFDHEPPLTQAEMQFVAPLMAIRLAQLKSDSDLVWTAYKARARSYTSVSTDATYRSQARELEDLRERALEVSHLYREALRLQRVFSEH